MLIWSKAAARVPAGKGKNGETEMKRIILAALVGLLLFPGVAAVSFSDAAKAQDKPSGIPVMWVGDGKSFDTAIFFISARSQSEAVLLESIHLNKNGYKSLQQSLIYKNGKRFDVHETDRGKVYFRLPSTDELK